MALEAGLIYDETVSSPWVEDTNLTPFIERFAALVAQHERNECLKFCDEVAEYFPSSGFVGSFIGSKIKARGQA